MKSRPLPGILSLTASFLFGGAVADAAPAVALVRGDGAADRLNLVFVPAGYRAATQGAFAAEVEGNAARLFGGGGVTGIPWYVENSDTFNVYRISGGSGEDAWSLPDNPGTAEVHAYIAGIRGFEARSDQGLVGYRNIHIVVTSKTGGDAASLKGWIRLRGDSDARYDLGHELAHVIACTNFGPPGQPNYDDEYVEERKCVPGRHTKFILNAHDRNSNDKWCQGPDGTPLITAPPFLGAWYCATGLYRPSRDSIMVHPGSGGSSPFGFDALGALAMSVGAGKRLGRIEVTPPTFSPVDVKGISPGGTCAGLVRVQARPADASGLWKVDFYWSKAGDVSRSLGFVYTPDPTGTYEWSIDTAAQPAGDSHLDIIAWDRNLNYTRVSTRVTVAAGQRPGK